MNKRKVVVQLHLARKYRQNFTLSAPLNFIALATIALTILLSLEAPVSAQAPAIAPSQIPQRPTIPNESTSPQIENRSTQEIILPNQILPSQELPALADSLFISEFRFSGNNVLSDEQLQQLAQPYTNREVTFAELLQLRSEITKLYVDKGYTTSGAYIPIEGNQKLDSLAAVVTLQIIEGTVGDIEVSGDSRLDNYVKQRLADAITPALNQPRLEEALRLLQIDPLIESISANLSSSSRIGSSILSIEVRGQPNFRLSTGIDNQRAPSAGSFERTAQLSATNVLALGESFKLGYSNTDGSNSFSASVDIPVNASGGTIAFDSAQLNGRIIEEPVDDFDIRTNSSVYTLAFQQPLWRTATNNRIEEFSLGIAVSRIESATTLSGFPFPLSPGADNNGETRLTELSLHQEYTRQEKGSALFARSRFDFGINAFNATVGVEPDGQYFAWRGQIAWLKQVLGDSQLSVSGAVQMTGDQLVPLSQFSLGGPTSIHGYRQDALIADSGLIAMAELAIPILEPGNNQQISFIPFAGAGTGWNNGAERTLDNRFLAAIGVGLRYEIKGLTARLNYAVPLTGSVGLQGNSIQEKGFDFELGYQLRF